MLIMSSCLLVACDKGGDEPAATTAATTEAEDEGGSKKPANPEAVDSVNGMNATELYQNAYTAYTSFESYDIEFIDEYDGERDVLVFKNSGSARYMKMSDEENSREYWEVDGVLYAKMGDQKLKITGKTLEALFGAEEILYMLLTPFHNVNEVTAKLDDAQLYSYAGEYYFEVSFTAEELAELDIEASESHSEKIYFDAQGNLLRVEIKSDDSSMTCKFKSYGKPVTVNAPADANSYVEYNGAGSGGDDPDDNSIYSKYTMVFDAIDNAEIYSLFVVMDSEPQLEYSVDGDGDEALVAWSDGEYYEMWHVGNYVYVSNSGDGEEYAASATPETLSAFESMRMQKTVASNLRLELAQISSMSSEETGDGGYYIIVNEDTGDGMEYTYTITYSADFSEIAISMNYVYNGEGVMNMSYTFENIGNIYYNIVAPF